MLGPTTTMAPVQVCDLTDGCITCGDVAVILTVVSLDGGADATDALCQGDDGRTEMVAVELVGAVTEGDRVLVHAGVALERLPERDGG